MALIDRQRLMIQKAKAGDAYAISRIISANTLRPENNPYSPLQKEVWLKHTRVDKVRKKLQSRPTFCAFCEGQIVGTIAVQYQEIIGLYVHPEFHYRGVGTKLLQFAENFARTMGLKKVSLNAAITAKSFYIQNGYTVSGSIEIVVDHVVFPEIRMKKNLD